MTAKRLVFTGKQQVQLENYEPEPLGARSVLVKTAVSLMSTGTENIVFNRWFEAGTGWDDWVKYPFYPGYAAVGTVAAVGAEVTTLQAGDRVAYRLGHRSHAVVDAAECYPIPAGIPFEQAVWFALAKITFIGARSAGYRLGDHALIIGAGPIGQMETRWAAACGVQKLIVADAMPSRLALATAGGATAVLAGNIGEARAAVLAAGDGQLPRVVVDSTGNHKVFVETQRLARDFGRIVLLGDTGEPSKQTLTHEVMRRGLVITGAHDCHDSAEWNNTTINRFFFQLVAAGRISLAGLNSHRFTPEQCAEAYDIANRARASTMGIIFEWSK
ncbi:MAG: zinc-binding alcohol dehydrogenase [Verrucomicrobiales bacterium]|nr:zinc-binding alcohol dehydrogenase [Verrucomicrobiales bacterium]